MDTNTVATRFVDLALSKMQWETIEELSKDELQILFNTVSAAGFNPKIIKPGRLYEHYLDDAGAYSDEKRCVNEFCPFKVVGQGDVNHYFATGWLNCALYRVVYGLKKLKENRERLIAVISREIEQSIPLESIQLSCEGDYLIECPPNKIALIGFEYFVHHTQDNDNLGSPVGKHQRCNGLIFRHRATETHDLLKCHGCHNLRVLFPKEVKTYKDLREVLVFLEA